MGPRSCPRTPGWRGGVFPVSAAKECVRSGGAGGGSWSWQVGWKLCLQNALHALGKLSYLVPRMGAGANYGGGLLRSVTGPGTLFSR